MAMNSLFDSQTFSVLVELVVVRILNMLVVIKHYVDHSS